MSNLDPPPLAPPKAPLGYLLAGAALWALAFAALLSPAPAASRPERYAAINLDPCVVREGVARP